MTDTIATDELTTVQAAHLMPHPKNIRSELGDIKDLTRSIKNQGVLVPLLVLPADADGMHTIVAGHRRYRAGSAAGAETFPVIIRDLTPVQVLDTMLTENAQRSDLSLTESIQAVARYQVLAPGDSPTKIGRRIGRTPTWVKSRLALAALPTDVLAMLDRGDLTIASATAIAAVIDLGDEAVRECAEHIASRRWNDDPTGTVTEWREKRDAEAERAEIIAKLDALGVTRFDSDHDARDAKAQTLDSFGLGLDTAQTRAHRHEPCHAVTVTRRYDNEIAVTGWCIDPKRHRSTTTRPAASEIAIEKPGAQSKQAQTEADKARKLARQTRHDAAAVALAKGRLPKGTLLDLAARVLIDSVGQPAVTKAAEFLAIDPAEKADGRQRSDLTAWLDAVGDPTRLLAALAGAELETYGRQTDPLPGHTHADNSGRWLDLLTAHGGYMSEGHDLA
ncbi:ParB/RepB/Spo0J family partition protein [Ilumatobacter nonamiensis]|uniref:ParB/RepB/Spo0J family partition protein n=1 Tax=Ilumatobacter nonamiensis TaxID=467093 RepID=UPI0003486070|nr:ParB/RepB/Spo0J family partition protein [Ilumatobacter nonamiensis]